MLIAKADITFMSLANNIMGYITWYSITLFDNIEFAWSLKPHAVTGTKLWLYTDQINPHI